jgi:hypothetical protein
LKLNVEENHSKISSTKDQNKLFNL